jgi:hypothetical protein
MLMIAIIEQTNPVSIYGNNMNDTVSYCCTISIDVHIGSENEKSQMQCEASKWSLEVSSNVTVAQ